MRKVSNISTVLEISIRKIINLFLLTAKMAGKHIVKENVKYLNIKVEMRLKVDYHFITIV